MEFDFTLINLFVSQNEVEKGLVEICYLQLKIPYLSKIHQHLTKYKWLFSVALAL